MTGGGGRAHGRRWGNSLARVVPVAGLVVSLALLASAAPGAANGNDAPGNPASFRAISVGGSHTCAILANGSVKCWGWNAFGQLGYGDRSSRGDGPNEMGANLPTVDLGTGRTAVAIAAGQWHTCALLDNGTVKCWGYNFEGELGLGGTSNRGDDPGEMGNNLPTVNLGTGRTAVAISAGQTHNCAILDDRSLKCWGGGIGGQLGQGNLVNRGDGSNEMGNNLPAIRLGTGRTVAAVSAGSLFTCAILDNRTVKCWGYNIFGQLGYGDTSNRGGGGISQMGDNLPTVALGTARTALAISAGAAHTCALLDNRTVKCWGAGSDGALGQGNGTTRGDGPGEMGDNLPAVSLGTGRTARSVSAGSGFTCARLDNATLKCWGSNTRGQLGLGTTSARGDGPGEMGNNLPTVRLGSGRSVVALAAGTGHACARLDNASLKCWGASGQGELGYGDTTTRGDGPGEMGDNLPPVRLGGAVRLA